MRVGPKTSLKVCEPAPNSGVLVLPITTAPAARRRVTISASRLGDVVGVDPRAVGGADPGGVHQVLDRDRQAVQEAGRLPAGDARVQLGGLGEGALGDEGDDRVDLRG